MLSVNLFLIPFRGKIYASILFQILCTNVEHVGVLSFLINERSTDSFVFNILILFVDRLYIKCISMIRIVHEVHDNEIRFRRLIDDIPQRSASPVVTSIKIDVSIYRIRDART